MEEEVQGRDEVTEKSGTGNGTEAGSLDKSKNRPMESGNALVTSQQRKIATLSQRTKDWSNERNIARLKEDSFGERRATKGKEEVTKSEKEAQSRDRVKLGEDQEVVEIAEREMSVKECRKEEQVEVTERSLMCATNTE